MFAEKQKSSHESTQLKCAYVLPKAYLNKNLFMFGACMVYGAVAL